MATLSIIVAAPDMGAGLRAKIAELGATLDSTIWHQDCTLEWQVAVDDAKLAELLAWCEMAGDCHIKYKPPA